MNTRAQFETIDRFLRAYYGWATPMFLVADLIWGAPVRVAGILPAHWRFTYYVALLLLGALCHYRPRFTPVVGLAESSVNLTLLVLSVLLPIWGAAGAVMYSNVDPVLFTPATLWNFALTAPVLVVSFKRNEYMLREMSGPDRQWRSGF